jgi:hypothetical protein
VILQQHSYDDDFDDDIAKRDDDGGGKDGKGGGKGGSVGNKALVTLDPLQVGVQRQRQRVDSGSV